MSAESQAQAVVVEDGHLSLSFQDLSAVPLDVAQRYGKQVTHLDLTGNQIRTGTNLELFPNLTELILDKNQLSSLENFPELRVLDTLWLNNNAIEDTDGVAASIARNFPKLRYLSLLRNPACPDLYFSDGLADAYKRYRLHLIHHIPTLEFLDATEVTDEEREEAERVGKFLRVARPDSPEPEEHDSAASRRAAAVIGTKSHNARRPEDEPRAAAFLARGRLRYDGSHSEGNRFIMNDDL